MKEKEYVDCMNNYNKNNPGREVELIIDRFQDEAYYTRNGERLDMIGEHEIIMYGE